MAHPNNLPESKTEYVDRLLAGKTLAFKNGYSKIETVLLFYHAEIPLEDAKKYVATLESKLG